MFLLNKQLFQDYRNAASQDQIVKKAELYTNYCIGLNNPDNKNSITLAIEKALGYSQELIDDYKNTRRNSRNIYYISQISTVVLSGLTPIFVLLDKLESGIPWLK